MKLKGKTIHIILHNVLLGLLLFLSFQMMGCSIFVFNQKTDVEFLPYVQEFENIITGSPYQHRIPHVTILFSDLNVNTPTSTLGVCYNMMLKSSSIKIDKTYWYNRGPLSRQSLIYHEMGHCICNIPHTMPNDSVIDKIIDKIYPNQSKIIFLADGCPNSLMYPYSLSTTCLEKHWNYYIRDLQNKCQVK